MKDAKGHGSNSRATATAAGYSVVHRPPLGHFVQGPSGEHGPYFAARGAWNDAARLATTFGGKAQDAAAAKELASGPKSDAAPVHDAMAPGYYSRASAKNGRALGRYGPHSDREAAANEALTKHPNVRGVSTSRGPHGLDIQWHQRK